MECSVQTLFGSRQVTRASVTLLTCSSPERKTTPLISLSQRNRSSECSENGYPSHASEASALAGCSTTATRRGSSAEAVITNFGTPANLATVSHLQSLRNCS